MSAISRTISKKKEIENSVENKIDTKFEEMQDKLNINSKNLDVIFENVAQNNQKEIDLIQEIKDFSISSSDNLEKTINKRITETQKQLTEKMNQIKQEELINPKLQEVKNEIIEKIESKQISIKPELEETQNAIYQKIQASQDEIEEKIENKQVTIKPELEEAQKEIYKKIETSQNMLAEKINQTQNALEEKISNVKIPETTTTATISSDMLGQLRQEISYMYQNENRYLIDSFMEEKYAYMKLIEEKDREIRNLNDRVYKCEEKLQKEIEKRHRASIFSSFFRKEEEPEVEPASAYTSQILSYLY